MPQQQSRFLKPGFNLPVLLVPALLLLGSVCQAEVLYKWLEADGTMTFSPEPPSDSSITYEKIVSGQGLSQSAGQSSGQAQIIKSATPTASVNNSGSLPPGLSSSPENAPVTTAAIQRPIAKPGLTRSTKKTAQCEELKKRVVSLERLLQTDISNETMDNAVVQMVRYQASFNQACNRAGLR